MNDSTRGRALLVVGYSDLLHADTLNDKDTLHALLHEIIDAVGMTVLADGEMVGVEVDPEKADSCHDCGGITGVKVTHSGYSVLSTSHIAIHTWPLHQRFLFDLASCHDFEPDVVEKLLVEKLGMTGGRIVDVDITPDPGLRERFERLGCS